MEIQQSASLTILYCLLLHFVGCREYCQWESFSANCPQGEVIVMKSAHYGRMEYGRCIERDYGYVGCSSDVLKLADKRCSGRRTCDIAIPDKDFKEVTPCPKDLVMYLAADYQCVKVESPTRRDCYGSKYMRLNKPRGYIASITAEETSCGTTDTPWVIEARPGQTINITLHDFSVQTPGNGSVTSAGGHCHVYAILKEIHTKRSGSLCGGRHRMQQVYTSTSHEVQVRMLRTAASSRGQPRYYMLEWTISGCPDISPVPGGWVERTQNEVLVGCNSSPDTWKLICKDSKWEGQVGSCSAAASQKISLGGLKFPQTLSIIIIIAVALAIGALILLIGLVCLKRRRNSQEPESKYSEPVTSGTQHEETYKTVTSGYSTGYSQPSLLSTHDTSGENEYEYVEDLIKGAPPPPPAPAPALPRGQRAPLPQNCAHHPYNQYGFDGGNPGFATIRGANLGHGTTVSDDVTGGNAYVGDIPQYYELDPEDSSGSGRGCDAGVPKERLVLGDSRQGHPNYNFGRYSQ